MVTEAGKELLRNTINTAKFHNRILEENEMWKQWELECGLTMMVSDDDIIKRIKKNHQCSKHSKRDKSRSRDNSHNKYEGAKIKQRVGSSNDRWDHSGFAELYPDAAGPDEHPSTSSSLERHKKKKKKSRHRSNSSDKEIWEEFKRPGEIWNKANTLRLIELFKEAPALWNINYRAYRNRNVKHREIERIASKFHVHEDELMVQIKFLMNKFHEEHKKSNEGCAICLEEEWFAYKPLTFLLQNNKKGRNYKPIQNYLGNKENPIWIDSSDSYSESEDEISAQPCVNQSSIVKNKTLYEKGDKPRKNSIDASTNSPDVIMGKSQKDTLSDYGEMVAQRMRKADKGSKAITRAKIEIDFILQQLEAGLYDAPEDTLK